MQFPVEPIAPGYSARLEIAYPNSVADALSLNTGELVAQFRGGIDDPGDPLFTARGADGAITLTRGATETLLTLLLPASATSGMVPDRDITFDIVRIDGGFRDVIPGRWYWPVRKTVTRNV